MLLRFFLLLTLLLTSRIALSVQLPEREMNDKPITIVLGLTGFAPYSSIDEKTGRCFGTGFAITQRLLLPENFKIKPFCAAPARVYRSVKEGKVDLTVNIKSTRSLQGQVTFTRIPFDKLKLNLYSNERRDDRKTVAAIRGYDYEGERQKMEKQGFTFFDVPDADNATNLFLNGRTAYLLSYENPYKYFLTQVDEAKRKGYEKSVEIEHIASVPTHYAISQSSPHHDSLVAAFNRIDENTLADQHFISQIIAEVQLSDL